MLLPAFTICYINWGAGSEFLAPLMALGDPFITGKPFALLSAVPLRNLVLLGGIFVLDLLALLFFLSDIYAVGTKSRTILIYNISVLVLTAAVLCGPAATPAPRPSQPCRQPCCYPSCSYESTGVSPCFYTCYCSPLP